jgi:hypothetical protein
MEEKMVKKSFLVPVTVLIFTMALAGNLEAQTNNRLNGTWVNVSEGIEFELRMRNGNFEELYNGVSFRRGTYTTTPRELTIVPTNIHGGGFNTVMAVTGIDFGLESKWYTFNEFIIITRAALIRLGASEREANDFVESAATGNTTSTYSVDGNSLILASTLQGQSYTIILTKK